MQMHYGEDKYAARIDAEEDTIRESICETAANAVFDHRPSRWISENVLDGSIYFNGEVVAQSLFACFIVVDRLVEFGFSFGMK